MKHLFLAAAFVAISSLPATALTEADLAPDALAGKTLTFTIVNGAAPFATTGSWTGTFGASPANSFTMTRVSGDTANIAGNWAYDNVIMGMYEYTLSPFIAGQADGHLTLYLQNGEGRYEVYLDGVFGVSQTGTFTIGSAVKKEPDIAVQQPAGTNLTDGTSKKSFGTAKIGSKGVSKTFTIKNTGKTKLTGIAIKKKGLHKSDFIVGAPGKTSLAAGASTTFKVSFKPTAKGKRTASLAISSNDPDENPFDIKLAGEGAKKKK